MCKIYTHDEATRLLEIFEDVLGDNDITVPSPEDDDREPDNEAALYGSVYSDLLDGVEDTVVGMLDTISGNPLDSGRVNVSDTAKEIVEGYEGMLSRCGIKVPSPEDDEREKYGDESALYGSVYHKLVNDTEGVLHNLVDRAPAGYIPYVYSGTY